MKEAAESLRLHEVVDILESSLKLDAGSLTDSKAALSNTDSLMTSDLLSSDLLSDPLHIEQSLETKESVFPRKQKRDLQTT